MQTSPDGTFAQSSQSGFASLSQRVLAASESQTLAIAARAKQMKAQGSDVISLSVGEPDFPSPDCAKKAAIEAIERNQTKYTDSNGILELRQAAAQKLALENGIAFARPENTLISVGAKHSIFNVLSAICNEGDEVVLAAPYWVSYPAMVTMCGAKPVVVSTAFDQGFKMSASQLAAALTPRTKCVVLNSPSNPTGAVYSKAELDALVGVLAQHRCYILSDEIYEKIIFDAPHISIGSYSEVAERVITVNGVSKAYSMTGWRIGYMTGHPAVIKEAAKVQGQSTSNPSSISQWAALGALVHGQADVARMRDSFRVRRDRTLEALSAIPSIRAFRPDGAFYIFLDVRPVLSQAMPSSAVFATRLLEEGLVATVPGEAFGTDGYVRLSYACSEEMLLEGVRRIGAFVQNNV